MKFHEYSVRLIWWFAAFLLIIHWLSTSFFPCILCLYLLLLKDALGNFYLFIFCNFGNPKLHFKIQACFALFTKTKKLNVALNLSHKLLFLVSRTLCVNRPVKQLHRASLKISVQVFSGFSVWFQYFYLKNALSTSAQNVKVFWIICHHSNIFPVQLQQNCVTEKTSFVNHPMHFSVICWVA